MINAVDSLNDYTAVANLNAPMPLASLASNARIDQSAQDFEAMFMTQMLEPMFDGLGNDPTFSGGHGEQIMRTFLLQEYGKIAAKGGHLGIAAEVKNEMIRAQATPSGPKAIQGGSNAPVI